MKNNKSSLQNNIMKERNINPGLGKKGYSYRKLLYSSILYYSSVNQSQFFPLLNITPFLYSQLIHCNKLFLHLHFQTPIRLASSRQSEFKVVFTGEANVGKTSLIRRICHGRFKLKREVTHEADFSTKIVECGSENQPVTLKLWDTVGQERFNSIPPSYFRKSDVVILVYDVEDEGSFLNAKKWLRMIHVSLFTAESNNCSGSSSILTRKPVPFRGGFKVQQITRVEHGFFDI